MFGVRLPTGARVFSTERSYRLWGQSSVLYSGYRRLFPSWLSSQSAKLTIHLYLDPRPRIMNLYRQSTAHIFMF
jgi:hypothetical protein